MLIPDPALGVSWGHQFDSPPRSHLGEDETTPDDIRENYGLSGPPREMTLAITEKIAEVVGVSGPLGDIKLAHRVYAQTIAGQWEWVHSEIPLARMIIEAEIYSEEFRRRHEWESFAKDLDPEHRNHPNFEHDRHWQKLVHEKRV